LTNVNGSQNSKNKKLNIKNLSLSYDSSTLKLKSILSKQNPRFPLKETKSSHNQRKDDLVNGQRGIVKLNQAESDTIKESTTQTLPIIKRRGHIIQLFSNKIDLSHFWIKDNPKTYNDAFKARMTIKKGRKPRSLNRTEGCTFPSRELQETPQIVKQIFKLTSSATKRSKNGKICLSIIPILTAREGKKRNKLMNLITSDGDNIFERVSTPKLVKKVDNKFDKTKQFYLNNALFNLT